MEMRMFRADNGKIGFNKYKVIVRAYKTTAKEEYSDVEYYVDSAGFEEIKSNVQKHALLEILEQTEIDISAYDWAEGISIDESDRANSIRNILSFGSLEAYKSSLQEARDEYLLDLDCRLSMIELGVTE